MKQLFFVLVFILLTATLAKAQEVKNIRFEQAGKQIVIFYDLLGENGTSWNISVYCYNGQDSSWGAPLQKLTGAAGKGIRPGTSQKVVWDVLAEREKLEGNISIVVEATKNEEPVKTKVKEINTPAEQVPNMVIEKSSILAPEKLAYSPEYYKYKKSKSFWMVSALITGAVGTYSYLQAGKYYDQYKTATTDAESLHQKVQLFDMISPVAYGIAGFCAVEFILKAGKQSKAKKQSLSFYPFPVNNGGGIGLAYTF